MNLSPELVLKLREHGVSAVHWSTVGTAEASDEEILRWARSNDHIVLTHDLDFTAILAYTQESAPSVVQLRTQDVAPVEIAGLVATILAQYRDALTAGALISVDRARARVRILPL